MKAHQFHKGQIVQNLAKVKDIPARSKWRVIDVIVRHKSIMLFGGEQIWFPSRIQMKLVCDKPPDPFGKTKPPRKPFNFVESRTNEDFPFSIVNKT